MIEKTTYKGSSSIGVFALATESYALIPKGADKLAKALRETLATETIEATVTNSSLLGTFCAGNDSILLLPHLATQLEIKKLKKHNPVSVEEKYTALGNLISMNEKTCIMSELVSKETEKKITKEGIDVIRENIVGLPNTGACIVLNKKGFLIHPDAEKKQLEKKLGLKGETSTVNCGNPYVSSGILANSNGAVVGEETTNFEIARIDQALVMQ